MNRLVAVFLPLALVTTSAAAQIHATVTDTRVISEMNGKTDTAFLHTVHAAGRTRVEHTGALNGLDKFGTNVQLMNFADSDFTMTFVDTTRKMYAVMQPSKFMPTAMAIADAHIKMESSNDTSTLENLGAGPVINGHRTVHFRTTTSYRMTMDMMGDTSVRATRIIADLYLAPDIPKTDSSEDGDIAHITTAVRNIVPSGLLRSAELRKNQAILAQNGTPLKTVMEIQETSSAGTTIHRTTSDVLRYDRASVPASLFAPPANYKKVSLMDLMTPF